MNSRLISKFSAEISRIDRASTGAGVDGFASGYDPIYMRPRSLPSGAQVGESAIVYLAPERIDVQVEEYVMHRRQSQGVGGGGKESRVVLVMLRADLAGRGWVGPGGELLLSTGDRLDAIYELPDHTLVVNVPAVFGRELYVRDVEYDGWGGLSGQARLGLVTVTFVAREVTRR